MKRCYRIVGWVLFLSIFITLLPIQSTTVYAAVIPVQMYVSDFKDGVLDLRWDKPGTVKSYRLTYHDPVAGVVTVSSNENLDTTSIQGLQNDIIYDLFLELFSAENQGGAKVAEGILLFLPRISFYSERIEEERTPVPGGGFEIGIRPRLRLSWVLPKVYVVSSDAFLLCNEQSAVDEIRNRLNEVYHNADMVKFQYKINISGGLSSLNSGATMSAINIEQNGTTFTAHVSGVPNTNVLVRPPDAFGMVSIDVLGRKDINEPLPAKEEFGLPHSDFFPGTVYYMNIKPHFVNDSIVAKYAVSVGKTSDQNGSLLIGAYPYTYTPIRFQLSKDAANNIYVKVYKVNQGSLDLPRLFYEIQSTDDVAIAGDWSVKKTIDDSFFSPGAQSAITLISGVGPNNLIYYRIVVKTDTSGDRIESLPLDYTLSEDSSKSPVPNGIVILDRTLATRYTVVDGQKEIQRSTDIDISIEKPLNWDEIKANQDPENDIVFHILLNTHQEESDALPYPELKADGGVYGSFPLKYRRMAYLSSKLFKENGNRLEYTLKGFELFKGTYYKGMDDNNQPIFSEESISNDAGYPNYLLPNTIYYMQMYTTTNYDRNSTDIEDMSDRSVIVTFTTKRSQEIDVPLPIQFRLNQNKADVGVGENPIVSNYVELEFDKVMVDFTNYTPDISVSTAVYYDVYMSTRPSIDAFMPIGTTQQIGKDVAFVGADDKQSSSVRLIVRNFSPGTEAYSLFGKSLRQNTTYYFIVRTRLAIEGDEMVRTSAFTSFLPVTTVRGGIGDADDTSKKPLAPTDFQVAKDPLNKELLITANKAVFTFTREESDVYYEFICTSRRVEAFLGEYDGKNDALYQSFQNTFGSVLLDPSKETLAPGLTYQDKTKGCTYTIDQWLFPNKLYYFSLRAIKKDNPKKKSTWVCVPVTTLMITEPSYLEVVEDVQLAFYFEDEDSSVLKEEYGIFVKGESDLRYNKLLRSQYEIEKIGQEVYVRIPSLKSNQVYAVRAFKAKDTVMLFDRDDMKTRDSYHEIEVKWRGVAANRYELAIKSQTDSAYKSLNELNLYAYQDSNGKILPYYKEKNAKVSGTDDVYFYARIKSIPTLLEDLTYEQKPLKSNTRYDLKLRAMKEDGVDNSIISYSKYVGPVSTRTEFHQGDYDKEEDKNDGKTTLLDRIKELDEKPYWRMDIGNGAQNKLFLKKERIHDAILESKGGYILDISSYAYDYGVDTIYIPIGIIKSMEANKKSLVLRSYDGALTIRPGTFDTNNEEDILSLSQKSNVLDVFLKVVMARKSSPSKSYPVGYHQASVIYEWHVDYLGASMTYETLKDQIINRVYDSKSGIVADKVEDILEAIEKDSATNISIDESIREAVADVERQVSNFLKLKVEGDYGVGSIIVDKKTPTEMKTPVMLDLQINRTDIGTVVPYALYKDSSEWMLTLMMLQSENRPSINLLKPGSVVLLSKKAEQLEILPGEEAAEQIRLLYSKVDLSDVFGISGMKEPDANVTTGELVLVFEKASEGIIKDNDLAQKSKEYGLTELIVSGGTKRKATRQELAKVLLMVYANQRGLQYKNLVPNKKVTIKDEKDVDASLQMDIKNVVALEIMDVDANGYFYPTKEVSRRDLVRFLLNVVK
jgi:hypothetical protein